MLTASRSTANGARHFSSTTKTAAYALSRAVTLITIGIDESIGRVPRSAVENVAHARPPLACASPRVYTEPYGSVFTGPPRCLVRRALGRHPTRRSGAARALRRFDHGSCRQVPDDPHGHEEARRRLGACRARHHGEGRARADLQDRPAPTGGRDRMDREVPPALGRTLRRVGQGCRGIETEGEGRWTQEERVRPRR